MKERLIELAKKKGLVIAEDAIQDFAELIFEGLDIIVEETDTKLDDAIYAPLKGYAKKAIDELIDKIDGEKE